MAKREYGKWDPQDMCRALEEFRKEKLKLNECCRKYSIPKKTFLRHLRGEVKRGSDRHGRPVNGRGTALPREAENELVEEILFLEKCMFGLRIDDVRKLAYDFMEANPHLKNPFSKSKQIAGKKWYYAFMKRHTELSLRQSESVSIARTRGFNKENVSEFFDILEKIVEENMIDALRIFNVDESGFSTVQKKSPKIISSRGKHQVGAISSGERGINTTFVCCTSAAGHYVPPMIIFKRQRMHPALAIGAPPGSLVECSESGYINSALFVKWLKHFIEHVKPTGDKKVLILLDGHSTHSKNLEAIKLARENGVLLLQLPGHTTHRLQPLDVAVFKPFQTFYDGAICKWLRNHPGEKVTQFAVAQLLAEAYTKCATLSNAASGFRATGIWPTDRNVFSETDFAANENLEHFNENIPIENENEIVVENDNSSGTNSSQPGQKILVHISEISPRPKASAKQTVRQMRSAQKSEELTSSPYKRKLENVQDRKTTKSIKPKQTKPRKAAVKISKIQDHQANKSKRNLNFADNVVVESNSEDWHCCLCEESVIEDMVQCSSCNKWAHESCSGCSKDQENFICDLCLAD